MKREDIRTWIKTEFQPVTLATPDETILQVIDNAIRYWNTHSAFKIIDMKDAVPGTPRVQLGAEWKNVVRVYPSTTPDWILQNHPLWTLLGITIIDNLTSDLVMMSEAFRNYRYYIGTDFHFYFDRNHNPDATSGYGGYLYLVNLPQNTTAIAVVGTKRIVPGEDITSEYLLDWLLKYSKAQVKMIEGNTLRKSDAIGVRNDGQVLVNEGKADVDALQKQLVTEGRWVSFTRKW
jgi:hypothetical protein